MMRNSQRCLVAPVAQSFFQGPNDDRTKVTLFMAGEVLSLATMVAVFLASWHASCCPYSTPGTPCVAKGTTDDTCAGAGR